MTSDSDPAKKGGAKKKGRGAKRAGKAADKTVSFSNGAAQPAAAVKNAELIGTASGQLSDSAAAAAGGATATAAAPADVAAAAAAPADVAAAAAAPAEVAAAAAAPGEVTTTPAALGEVTTTPAALGEVPTTAAAPGEAREVTEEEKMALVDAGYKRLCSDATLQTKKDGYFRTYDSQVLQSIPEEQFEEFKKLTTDEERIFFVWNIPTVHSTVSVKPFSRKKSAKKAEDDKQTGNMHFQHKKYRTAVCNYSQMVVRAPHPGDEDAGDLLSVGYANRSAALLHMEEYRLCLQDIEAALAASYPARLRYKLLDRRATCQLKLGQVTAARETLKELPAALELAELDPKKKAVWEKDAQKKIESAARMQDFKPIMLQVQKQVPSLPSRSDHFVSASGAVDVAYSPGEGRYAVAAQDVHPGDLLVVEKPHASILMAEKTATHCVHCLKRVLAAFPCRECSGVMFCSPECAAAAAPYHRWECSIQDVLQASGMSPLCHLALRLVTKHGLEFFTKLRPELERRRESGARPSTDAEGRVFDPENYLAVHQLVKLAELRKPEDFFHRTLMAVLLLKHLRVAGFFGVVPEEDSAERLLSADELLIGGLLLHHLQLLQFNAHEVGEYVMMEPNQFKQSRSVYIGVAVYPTVSFFNHSCEGGVSRCFVGDTLVVHSVQLVAAGQPIFENYGPIYSHKAKRDRHHWLSSRYWFDCKCVACEENWADYDQYDINTVVLKCPGCGGGIANDASGKDPVGDCSKCGKKNNAVELFRQLGSAQENYHSAMNMMHEGEPKKALRLFYRFIEQCEELVVRPNRDLSLCQEAARMCLASLGSLHFIRQKKTS